MFSKVAKIPLANCRLAHPTTKFAKPTARISFAPSVIKTSGRSYSSSTTTRVGALGSSKWIPVAVAAVGLASVALMSNDDEKNNNSRSMNTNTTAFNTFSALPKSLFNSFVTFASEKVPIFGVAGTNKERSFIAVKPDGVHRGYVGEVISRFEEKGYKLVAIKVVVPTKDFAEKHYSDLSKKPFFPSLVNYFSSGPVVAMVWEGKDVITGGRSLIGATNPQQATPGTIRGDYCITIGRNMIHGSDSPDSAKNEISLWFTEKDVADFDHAMDKWVHEK